MAKFKFSTAIQTAEALRERFRSARGLQAARIATWLLANLTDLQLRTLFGGLTAAQVSALKTRLKAKADRLTALENDLGE